MNRIAAQILPSVVGLLLIFAALIAAARPVYAQSTPDSSEPPAAPTPKQDQVQPPQTRTPLQTTFHVLAKRSIFFPELAFEKGPLDARQKFELAVDETLAPSRFLASAFTAGISQARNSLPGYGQDWGGYGKRFGSSVASNASSHLFGSFLLPSALHEDPRYFVKLYGNGFQRIGYALSRVAKTRKDDGSGTFNWSFIGGACMAEALATSYLPSEERTVGKTFDRIGVRVGFGAVSNIFKEYWPTIFKDLRIAKLAPVQPADPGTVTPGTATPPSETPHPPDNY